MNKEKKWYNNRQLESMAIGANIEVIIAPRGFGKSTGVDCPRLLRNTFAMPTSVGALLSPTYKKLLTNTLPPVIAGLKSMGYLKDVHYFIGKKAPKKAGFKEPHTQPADIARGWENTMHWYNGSIQQMLSFDMNMSANSMNLDYVLGFEAKYLKRDKIKNEVTQANRGNRDKFEECPWHHSWLLTTDMPTNQEGLWLFEYEKLMDPELIDVIKSTYKEYNDLKGKPDTDFYNRARQKKWYELNQLRKAAIYFDEYNALDNFYVLGEKFYRDMERDLPPLLFATSILNKRLRKVEGGFYASLNEELHTYLANDNSALGYCDYNLEKVKNLDCQANSDIDKEQPLAIGMDYNAAISNICCGQKDGRTMRTLKSFYVKTPFTISDLVTNFCSYYRTLPKHEVVYYYDHTAVWKNPSTQFSYAEDVINTFERLGWTVYPVYLGQADKHDQKYLYINKAFRGDPEFLFPTFNKEENEYLILALNLTGIKQGKNGFEKDKSFEKDADSPEFPDQNKTHVTDAWDTLYKGLNWQPYTDISSGGAGSVMG